jgi:hypothetical protein
VGEIVWSVVVAVFVALLLFVWFGRPPGDRR